MSPSARFSIPIATEPSPLIWAAYPFPSPISLALFARPIATELGFAAKFSLPIATEPSPLASLFKPIATEPSPLASLFKPIATEP